MSSELVNIGTAEFVKLAIVLFRTRHLLALEHVLLGRLLLLQHVVLGFLGRFGHEVVLSEDFLCVFELASFDIARADVAIQFSRVSRSLVIGLLADLIDKGGFQIWRLLCLVDLLLFVIQCILSF